MSIGALAAAFGRSLGIGYWVLGVETLIGDHWDLGILL